MGLARPTHYDEPASISTRGAKHSGATLRLAPPALAPGRHNLEGGGQLFDADWSAPLRVDR